MSAILNNKIETVIYSIAKTAELSLQYGDDYSKDKKTYEKLIFDIATVSSNAQVVENCISNSKDVETVSQFEEQYTTERRKTKINVRSSNHYKDWMSKISAIIEGNLTQNLDNQVQDEDFEMTAEIGDIDPITKKKMESPLKNKICGHHYEKDSILKVISKNKRFRCPIVGCSNREFMQKDGLEEDLDFKLKLRRMRN